MLCASHPLAFGDFRFNVRTRELLRSGCDGSMTPIPLGSRAAEILLLMLQRHGELLSKNEIMTVVWPDTAVEDSNLLSRFRHFAAPLTKAATARAVFKPRRDGATGSPCLSSKKTEPVRVGQSLERLRRCPISLPSRSFPSRT